MPEQNQTDADRPAASKAPGLDRGQGYVQRERSPLGRFVNGVVDRVDNALVVAGAALTFSRENIRSALETNRERHEGKLAWRAAARDPVQAGRAGAALAPDAARQGMQPAQRVAAPHDRGDAQRAMWAGEVAFAREEATRRRAEIMQQLQAERSAGARAANSNERTFGRGDMER